MKLAAKTFDVVGAGLAREIKKQSRAGPAPTGVIMPVNNPGHAALRKGRVSVPNGVYLVTATTIERTKVFENFHAACAASRCFEDRRLLGNAAMLAWVLMPDHAHW